MATNRNPPLRLVFFGDSICVGQGISIHKSWVARIAARVEEITAGTDRDIVVVNASVNGSTTRQALERMPYEVQSPGVDVLVVQFGLNDCNYWLTDRGVPRVSPAGFAANLSEIIVRGIRFGAKRVLLNTNHPTSRTSTVFPETDVTYEQSNRKYNDIIRQVAADNPPPVLQLNDVEKAFERQVQSGRYSLSELLLEDGLHLTALGHQVYYELIAPVLDGVLSELGFRFGTARGH